MQQEACFVAIERARQRSGGGAGRLRPVPRDWRGRSRWNHRRRVRTNASRCRFFWRRKCRRVPASTTTWGERGSRQAEQETVLLAGGVEATELLPGRRIEHRRERPAT
jgi:hypothetical protein